MVVLDAAAQVAVTFATRTRPARVSSGFRARIARRAPAPSVSSLANHRLNDSSPAIVGGEEQLGNPWPRISSVICRYRPTSLGVRPHGCHRAPQRAVMTGRHPGDRSRRWMPGRAYPSRMSAGVIGRFASATFQHLLDVLTV